MDRRTTLAALAALACVAGTAAAQGGYPAKPVTLVVPYAAGGATDVVARIFADAWQKDTQQPFVVENRPGANGLIALEYVSRAPKDGSVLLVGNPATNALLPVSAGSKARFDIQKAFVPVARLASVPGVLVASRKLPVSNFKELIAYARKNPGKVSYASAGNGSLAHLEFLAIEEQARLDMIHVAYKGGPQALTDNIAGLVHLNFLNLTSALPLVKDGRLTALAVAGSERVEQLPDVPTVAEAGFEGSGGGNWQGAFAPAGTPQAVIDRLAALALQAAKNPGVLSQLRNASVMAVPTASPAEFRKFVDGESDGFRRLVTKHNITFD